MLQHFQLQQALTQQQDSKRYRALTNVSRGVTPMIHVNGKDYLNFASNDYLGLASHSDIAQSLVQATLELGQVGSGASHLITGHHEWHDELAKQLAQVTGYEKALTFSTGYMANVGLVQALCQKDTDIFSDKLNHASIIDGGILSRGNVIRFNHRDYAQLEQRLSVSSARQKFIITDHVFSMDGTLADLETLHKLAQRYECALVIDDAHGFGLPYQAHKNQLPLADIYVGTLGKAIGTFGAFIASSSELIDYLTNFARSFIYTTAMPPALAKATQTAVDIAFTDITRQMTLQTTICQLADGLSAQGWQVGMDKASCQTAIIPVLIGDNEKTIKLANQLKMQGFWVSAIRPPTVPMGTARLRFCVSSAHTSEQIEALLFAMQSLYKCL